MKDKVSRVLGAVDYVLAAAYKQDHKDLSDALVTLFEDRMALVAAYRDPDGSIPSDPLIEQLLAFDGGAKLTAGYFDAVGSKATETLPGYVPAKESA